MRNQKLKLLYRDVDLYLQDRDHKADRQRQLDLIKANTKNRYVFAKEVSKIR